MDKKFQYFNGKRFTRDEDTGYYLCSTKCEDGRRKRMHVYVWEYYNGKVQAGFHVHHIDEDKSNNCIENLELLPASEHLSFHAKEYSEGHHEEMIKNLNENAVPRAREWHRSEEGRNWHKAQYEKTKDKLFVMHEYCCEQCGEKFESTQKNSRFCSNRCKSNWRRYSGKDDITKICEDCGGEYIANKYSKTKYCEICRNKKHKRNRKI